MIIVVADLCHWCCRCPCCCQWLLLVGGIVLALSLASFVIVLFLFLRFLNCCCCCCCLSCRRCCRCRFVVSSFRRFVVLSLSLSFCRCRFIVVFVVVVVSSVKCVVGVGAGATVVGSAVAGWWEKATKATPTIMLVIATYKY